MHERVKTIRLWQMIYLGKGAPLLRQIIHAIISIALRLFFRRIEVVGVERVPWTGPLLFVLNHPNGLVDPALVFVSMPRRVSFLAKSTLFDNPIGAFVLRTFEILPVYRRIDPEARSESNAVTFDNCFELLRRGRCIAIFPEGISHDQPHLQKMKTGAARIALGAVSDRSAPAGSLKIVPVGLYYTSKTSFRSEALIRYGEIFDVEPIKLDADGEPPRDAVAALTAKIERHLRDVTLNLETETELDAVLKAEALFSSVFENLIFKQTLTQTVRRLQDLATKYALLEKSDPQKMLDLNAKLARYENDLKASGLTTESLSILQHPTRYVLRYLILRVIFLIVLAPLAFLGAIIHSPAYFFSNLMGRIFRTHDVDVAGSSSTIVAAIGLMPLTWLVVASILWYNFGWQIALIGIPVTIVCGYIALRSSETLIDMRVWLKAAWLLFRQRGLFFRLLVQRESLQKEIGELVEK
ncbi:MAG TPA: lysophospholipid acyltransferase family protein [Pyrinomonadaceae bacterium]|nr:lysophospholipid acyltransferase family protein [Pyrinomonadaceae bacterium]